MDNILINTDQELQSLESLLYKYGEILQLRVRFRGDIDDGKTVRYSAKQSKDSSVLLVDISGVTANGIVNLSTLIDDVNIKTLVDALPGNEDKLTLYSEVAWLDNDNNPHISEDIILEIAKPVLNGGPTTGPLPLDGTISIQKIIANNVPVAGYALTVDTDGKGKWVAISGVGAPQWGDIEGTLSAQTDLQAQLDAKATLPIAISDTTGLQAALDSKASASGLSAHIADTGNPHSVTKTQVGLSNVDNTSDVNKPISTATQTALDLKANASGLSSHIANTSNPHSVTATQVNLGNVANNAPDSAAVTASQRTLGTSGVQACAGNDARLSDTRIPTDNSVTNVKVASNAAIDITKLDISGTPNGTKFLRDDASWQTVSGGGGGTWGSITGTLSDQTDLQDVLDTKAPIENPSFTGDLEVAGNITTIAGAFYGDGSGLVNVAGLDALSVAVDDLTASLSTTNSDVLDLQTDKANIASPTFTGTVGGIDKTMVGLPNIDNTSDANKPVSTAQQTALNLKANLASPTFTGTPVFPSSVVTLANIANIAANTMLGNNTGSPAAPIALSAAQAKTNLSLTASDVSLGNVVNNAPGSVAGTACQRTLGTGSTDACAGNDSRLSDNRTPSTSSVVDASVSASAAIALSKLALIADQRILGNVSGSSTAPSALTTAQVLTALGINGYKPFNIAVLQHTAASGSGGGAATTGAYTTRTLNTEAEDPDGIVTLSSNQFTLGAGTYRVIAHGVYYRTSYVSTKLRNVTDSTDQALGTCGYAQTTDGVFASSLDTQFTISGSKAFAVQYYVESNVATTNSLGSLMTHGTTNVFMTVTIMKINSI